MNEKNHFYRVPFQLLIYAKGLQAFVPLQAHISYAALLSLGAPEHSDNRTIVEKNRRWLSKSELRPLGVLGSLWKTRLWRRPYPLA